MEIGEHSPGQGKEASQQAPRRPVQTSHSHPDVWLEDGVNVEHVGRQLVKSVTSM